MKWSKTKKTTKNLKYAIVVARKDISLESVSRSTGEKSALNVSVMSIIQKNVHKYVFDAANLAIIEMSVPQIQSSSVKNANILDT